ncbi:DUF5819 family protein [Leucobacter luti]|uniref:DUF5819 family protein n=1 Tax=Leucobacter luti TaxID=340320 RepID=UPI001C688719|nr:DUF5819 family protein [Leucobacter luti]QYM75077.1 hypothetical protein K1X41_10395 [Leucobacter luti]
MVDQDVSTRRRASEGSTDRPRLPFAAKVIAGAAVVLLGGHMFLTAVYNAPSEELKYGVLPGAVADRYIRPYLVQDYKIFAPDPADTDRQLWVRAWVEEPDGERVRTDWINASHVELSEAYRKTLRKQLSVVGAERLMAAYSALGDAQKQVAAENHLDGKELYALNDALLAADDSNAAAVSEFIRADNYVTSYATQVAHAMWGEEGEIVGVQARAVYDPVIRWADRRDPDAQRPPSRYTDLGWVPPMEWPGQDREAFTRTFRAWAEQAGEGQS